MASPCRFCKVFKSKVSTTEPEVKKSEALVSIHAARGPDISNTIPAEDKKELGKPTSLNAFLFQLDLIFQGCLLEKTGKREVKFASLQSASTIISKLEEIVQIMGLKVKEDGGHLELEGSKEGIKGALSINAEIFEFTPCFHLVKMKSCGGDTLEYHQTTEETIRPALKDKVWAWQIEQVQQQEQIQENSS